jgi:Uma2 family endonuclease
MKLKTPATIEDLYKVDGKAELIDGEIIFMSPTGFSPARAAGIILHSLMQYERQTPTGVALPDGVGYIVDLARRKSFSPDASFYTGELPGGVNMKFIEGAPIFAVEVRSENDYGNSAEKKISAKRADYFAAGTQVVWDVDLQSEDVVRSYRKENPDHPAIFRRGDIAGAEPALLGWKIPVDDLFR